MPPRKAKSSDKENPVERPQPRPRRIKGKTAASMQDAPGNTTTGTADVASSNIGSDGTLPPRYTARSIISTARTMSTVSPTVHNHPAARSVSAQNALTAPNAVTTPNASLQNALTPNALTAQNASLQNVSTARNASLQNPSTAQNASLQNASTAPNVSLQNALPAPSASIQNALMAPSASIQNALTAPSASIQSAIPRPPTHVSTTTQAPAHLGPSSARNVNAMPAVSSTHPAYDPSNTTLSPTSNPLGDLGTPHYDGFRNQDMLSFHSNQQAGNEFNLNSGSHTYNYFGLLSPDATQHSPGSHSFPGNNYALQGPRSPLNWQNDEGNMFPQGQHDLPHLASGNSRERGDIVRQAPPPGTPRPQRRNASTIPNGPDAAVSQLKAELAAARAREDQLRSQLTAMEPPPVPADPNKITPLIKPKGEAGDRQNGYQLRPAMGLDGCPKDRATYKQISDAVKLNAIRAGVDITKPYSEQDHELLAKTFKAGRQQFSYLTRERFPHDWAQAAILKQYITNHRRNLKRTSKRMLNQQDDLDDDEEPEAGPSRLHKRPRGDDDDNDNDDGNQDFYI